MDLGGGSRQGSPLAARLESTTGQLLLVFFLVARGRLTAPLLYLSAYLERNRQAAAAVGTPNALALVKLICENPVVTTRSIEDRLGVSRPTALRLLRRAGGTKRC